MTCWFKPYETGGDVIAKSGGTVAQVEPALYFESGEVELNSIEGGHFIWLASVI